jgi:site-specific recombinase XerD
MIEQLFRSGRVVRRLRGGALGSALEDLVAYLLARGYSRLTVQRYVGAVEHFDGWRRRGRRPISTIDEVVIGKFLQEHVPRCRCRPPRHRTLHDLRASLGHLLTVLRETGRVAGCSPPPKLTRAETLVREFVEHVRNERGAAEITCTYSARYAREFLDDQFGARRIDLSRVGMAEVTAFLAERAHRWTPESMKVAAVSLRRFFRYLQLVGLADERLTHSVPGVAGWKLAAVPRVLPDEQLIRLLASFDRSTPIGLRGYASTTCLVRLGLRPCEVAALTLDDVNWRAGIITVPATKSRRADVLPLPSTVARALIAYLRRGRPPATTRRIFVRHATPVGTPMGPGHVRVAVRAAGARIGLMSGSINANMIRHTVATRLLRSGATMKEVADVLRHRSIDTAAIYAKVDIEALRDVAGAWPRRTT